MSLLSRLTKAIPNPPLPLIKASERVHNLAAVKATKRGARKAGTKALGPGAGYLAVGAGIGIGVHQQATAAFDSSTDFFMENFLGDKEADQLITGQDVKMSDFWSLPQIVPDVDAPLYEQRKAFGYLRNNAQMRSDMAIYQRAKIQEIKLREAKYQTSNGNRPMPFADGSMVFGMYNTR